MNKAMKRFRKETEAKRLLAIAIGAGLLVGAMPARAAQVLFTGTRENATPVPVPGTGRCVPAYFRTITIAPGALSSTGTSNFGSYTADMSHCEETAALPRDIIDGLFTFNFAAGDSLFGTYSGAAALSGMPGSASILHNFVVTGGTGRFLGATGALVSTGTLQGVMTANGPVGMFTGVIEGRLSGPNVPEPASWAMLIAGFALAGGMLRQRRAGPVLRRCQAGHRACPD